MSQIILKNVTKEFPTRGNTLGVTAVDNFNLTVNEGCGKTITLRMIAGFEDLSAWEIWLGDKPVSIKAKNLYVPPEERGLGMVFQSFAVWPHLNVFENVAFPLRVMKRPKDEIKKRVREALDHTDLLSSEREYPSDLSGGQQQRLCIARAIAMEPEVILMDEPTSALDPIATLKIEELINNLKENYAIVIVTHSMQQAARISDNTAFFHMGELIEYDTTDLVFTTPKNQKTEDYITGRFG